MAFTLPELGYEYDGLQPYIDAETMEIHHSKHHNAYVNNLNAAIKDTEFESMELEDIMKHISKASPAIRNNGGGHYNHSLFLEIIVTKRNSSIRRSIGWYQQKMDFNGQVQRRVY